MEFKKKYSSGNVAVYSDFRVPSTVVTYGILGIAHGTDGFTRRSLIFHQIHIVYTNINRSMRYLWNERRKKIRPSNRRTTTTRVRNSRAPPPAAMIKNNYRWQTLHIEKKKKYTVCVHNNITVPLRYSRGPAQSPLFLLAFDRRTTANGLRETGSRDRRRADAV